MARGDRDPENVFEREDPQEIAWQKALRRYQWQQSIEFMKEELRKHEPPNVHIDFDIETKLWFDARVPNLEGLDELMPKIELHDAMFPNYTPQPVDTPKGKKRWPPRY